MINRKISFTILMLLSSISRAQACPKMEGVYSCTEEYTSDTYKLKIEREESTYNFGTYHWVTDTISWRTLIADSQPRPWPRLDESVGIVFCDDQSLKINYEGSRIHGIPVQGVINYSYGENGKLEIVQVETFNPTYVSIETTNCDPISF